MEEAKAVAHIKGIGINVDTFTVNGRLKKFRELLNLFNEIGFDYVELPVAGLDVILNEKLDKRRVEDIKKILSEYHFRKTVHAPDVMNLKAPNPKHFNVFKSVIEFAKEVEAEVIVYHTGVYIEDTTPRVEQRKMEINRLKELLKLLEGTDIKIGMENIPMHHTVENIIKIIEEINHPQLGMTLDIAHLYITVKNNPELDLIDQIEKAIPHVVEFHISDNFGEITPPSQDVDKIYPFQYVYGIGDLHLPLGMGEIPYEEIFNLIKASNFSGIVMLEINDLERYVEHYDETLKYVKEKLNMKSLT